MNGELSGVEIVGRGTEAGVGIEDFSEAMMSRIEDWYDGVL